MIGTLNSVALTAGTAVTITNIVSGSEVPGVEVVEKHYQSAFPDITLGNINYQVSFVTTDISALKLVQGNHVTAVTLTFNGVATAIDGADMTLTNSTDTVTVTVSDMYIVESITLDADNEGKNPSQYSVTLKACKNQTTKADPTITRTIGTGA